MNYSLQSERILKILLVALALATFAVISTPLPRAVRAAGPWYVASAGSDGNDCLSAVTACGTINGAIGKASSGDTILIASGTFTGTGTEVALLNKNVTLSGGWDGAFATQSASSTIDGQGLRRGITVSGTVTVTIDRFVVQNGFDLGGGGGGIQNNGGNVSVSNSAVISSTSSYPTGGALGGGIYNLTGTLSVTNSTISGNIGDFGGGGIANTGFGTVILTNSSVSGNTAGKMGYSGGGGGGGIENSGTLVVNNSTVSGNTLLGSFSGSGIYGAVTLNNSTVSDNTNGDGIYGFVDTISLNSSTVSGNGARGINNVAGTVNLKNSIMANNTTGDCYNDPSYSGTINSLGYNLVRNNVNCTLIGSDLTNVNPMLGPLQNNGGATLTHALLVGSLAINHGNPSGCTDSLGNPLSTDQRGFPRVGRCDIGAYEYQGVIYQVFLPLISRACPDFFDDFSNPSSGWPIIDDSYLRTEYLSGEYRMLSKQSGFIFRVKAPTSDRQNYSVETDARWVGTPGSSYGLIFAVTSGFNQYYLFDMNTDYQQYRVLRRDPGPVYTTIVSVTSSSAIASGNGTNHLKAIRNGSQHTIAVNGTTLTTFMDSAIGGLTGTGLATIPYSNIPTSDARFDNYSLLCQLGGGNAPTQLNGPSLLSPDGFRENAPSKLHWPKR